MSKKKKKSRPSGMVHQVCSVIWPFGLSAVSCLSPTVMQTHRPLSCSSDMPTTTFVFTALPLPQWFLSHRPIAYVPTKSSTNVTLPECLSLIILVKEHTHFCLPIPTGLWYFYYVHFVGSYLYVFHPSRMQASWEQEFICFVCYYVFSTWNSA